jgi:PKD repeat protein
MTATKSGVPCAGRGPTRRSTFTTTDTYTASEVYTVSLTASGLGGSDTLTRTNYITAMAAPTIVSTTVSYTYDSLYRLISATYSSGEFYEWPTTPWAIT